MLLDITMLLTLIALIHLCESFIIEYFFIQFSFVRVYLEHNIRLVQCGSRFLYVEDQRTLKLFMLIII
jgi:hypothetical protein